ncbi:MAG: hypothetical protein Q9163_004073, partial [Psora crenata]
AILFLRLPIVYHGPYVTGLTYKLALVGVYGSARVIDLFFIDFYGFHHVPRRVRHHYEPREEAGPNDGPSTPVAQSLPSLHVRKGQPVVERAESERGWPQGWADRASWALELMLTMRGGGFTWTGADVRRTKRTWRPRVVDRLHTIVVYTGPVALLSCAVLRNIYVRYLSHGPVGFDDLSYAVQASLTAATGIFLMAAFSITHSAFAILLVPLSPHPLSYLPPMYTARIWQITSVRMFWTYGWHRFFSRLFLVYGVWPGEWLERTVMGKSKDEPADVGKVLGAFLCSALFHTFAEHTVVPGGWKNATAEAWFFAQNAVAVLVEEGVRRVVMQRRRRQKEEKTMGSGLERWYDPIIGRIWWIAILLYTGRNFARAWVVSKLENAKIKKPDHVLSGGARSIVLGPYRQFYEASQSSHLTPKRCLCVAASVFYPAPPTYPAARQAANWDSHLSEKSKSCCYDRSLDSFAHPEYPHTSSQDQPSDLYVLHLEGLDGQSLEGMRDKVEQFEAKDPCNVAYVALARVSVFHGRNSQGLRLGLELDFDCKTPAPTADLETADHIPQAQKRDFYRNLVVRARVRHTDQGEPAEDIRFHSLRAADLDWVEVPLALYQIHPFQAHTEHLCRTHVVGTRLFLVHEIHMVLRIAHVTIPLASIRIVEAKTIHPPQATWGTKSKMSIRKARRVRSNVGIEIMSMEMRYRGECEGECRFDDWGGNGGKEKEDEGGEEEDGQRCRRPKHLSSQLPIQYISRQYPRSLLSQQFQPFAPPAPSSLGKAAPPKTFSRTKRWSRRLAYLALFTAAIYAVDREFYASSLTRSSRCFGLAVLVAADYKINFRPHPPLAPSIAALHARNAERLFDLLRANGGLYLKIGQAIAMQSAILPPEFQKMFSKMFDDAPQNSWAEVSRVIEEDFGKSPEEVFGVSFDGSLDMGIMERSARASASVAQVHWARLTDGREVAIKIQKREIAQQVGWDLWAFKYPKALLSAPTAINLVPYITERLLLETDFINEADNAERMAKLVAGEPRLRGRVYIPKVYRNLTSKRVMTAEWIEGVRLWDKQNLTAPWKGRWRQGSPGAGGSSLGPPKQEGVVKVQPSNQVNWNLKPDRDSWKGEDGRGGLGLNLKEVMTTMIDLFSAQMFLWGWVHCDPHPGNIFIRRLPSGKPELVLIDHGLYIHMKPEFRHQYSLFWKSLMTFDNKTIQGIIQSWGIKNADIFASATLMRPYTGGDNSTSAEIKKGLSGKQQAERAYEAQQKMRKGIREILSDEKKWPRELIFIGRNLRIVQGNNQFLGSPVNRIKITGNWASRSLVDSPDLSFSEKVANLGRHLLFKMVLFSSDLYFYASKVKQFFGAGEGMEDDMEAQMKHIAKDFGVELNHSVFEG